MAKKKKPKKLKARKKRILRPKAPKKEKPALIMKKLATKKPAENGIHKTKIKVIGIGGGGGSIISEIGLKIKKVRFAAANTDWQALKQVSQGIERFQFGQSFTGGLGTGMNPDLAMEAAQAEKERIAKILEGQDLCILVACLGGGTGSGAAPVFAKIAKSLGIIIFGIFTLPFKFEGEKKMEIARTSLEKIKPNLNVVSLIPNERIFQVIDKSTPLKAALSAINKILADGLEGLIETIYLPGLINIDFADLKTVLEGRGRLVYLNTIEASAASVIDEKIKELISSPLYPYSIQGAKGVLFNISGEKSVELEKINQISKTIFNLVNKEAKIIFGVAPNSKYKDKIKITLLATGCGARIYPQLTKKEEKKPARKRRRLKKKPLLHFLKIKKVKPEEKKEIPPKKISKPEVKTKPGPKTIKKNIKLKAALLPKLRKEKIPPLANPTAEEKIRKSALQIQREIEAEETAMLKQEKQWESPAFLRKKRKIIYRGLSSVS